jgi:phosphoribosylanthranilate isomerase
VELGISMIGKIHIKVCGMKMTANRESLEELPIDYFGFIFYPGSTRFVGNCEAEILFKLLNTPKFRTGVFVDTAPAEIVRTAKKVKLTHIQLHGRETPDECEQIRRKGFKVIKSFSVYPDFDFTVCNSFAGRCNFFLFDTKGKLPGGTGEKFNWEILNRYELNVPFFLSGGISPGDESAILRLNHPAFYGIDLNSGFEDAPGVKDSGKIKLFLSSLSFLNDLNELNLEKQ